MVIILMKLLKKGAEADIYSTNWNKNKAIVKIRKSKDYRNPELDNRIRKQRTQRESEILSQIKSFGIPSPIVYSVNPKNFTITMQEIPGKPVHDLPDKQIIQFSKQIGRLVGLMHKNGIMHGDLTTSNFLLYKTKIFAVDFGLSQRTEKPEDFAVDLRLIKEILNSAHANIMEKTWKNFISGYSSAVGNARCTQILGLVSIIEGRGRYATVV